jgi:hypothetical protein
METLTTPENGNGQATVPAEPNRNKKARVAPRAAHVVPSKATLARKTSPAKKAPQAQKKATTVRTGSKTAKLLELLKRPEGATLKQLMRAAGWQAHSVRGFLSAQIRKKMALPLRSFEREGERVYTVHR